MNISLERIFLLIMVMLMLASFTVNYEEYDGFEDRGELIFSQSAAQPMVHG